MNRIERHPVLDIQEQEPLVITVDGKEIEARKGDSIAAALLANGIRVFRRTHKYHETRGVFCGIGQCTDCIMEVDGMPNVRTCVTPVRAGMIIRTQDGCGSWKGTDGRV
jgi:predicted molibdopterin-dependent oxidoreductase YjgC